MALPCHPGHRDHRNALHARGSTGTYVKCVFAVEEGFASPPRFDRRKILTGLDLAAKAGGQIAPHIDAAEDIVL